MMSMSSSSDWIVFVIRYFLFLRFFLFLRLTSRVVRVLVVSCPSYPSVSSFPLSTKSWSDLHFKPRSFTMKLQPLSPMIGFQCSPSVQPVFGRGPIFSSHVVGHHVPVVSSVPSNGFHTRPPISPPSILDYFPGLGGDGLRVSWAHAVNSRSKLNSALIGENMACICVLIIIHDFASNLNNVLNRAWICNKPEGFRGSKKVRKKEERKDEIAGHSPFLLSLIFSIFCVVWSLRLKTLSFLSFFFFL